MRCKPSSFNWDDSIFSSKIREFTSNPVSLSKYVFRMVLSLLLSNLLTGIEINISLQAGCCLFLDFSYLIFCICYLYFCREHFLYLHWWQYCPVFLPEKELNNSVDCSVLQLEKKTKRIFTFSFLDSLAPLRPTFIESPTISVVLDFHSSASILLSVLLVRLYTLDCVLGNIRGASDCFVNL